MNLDKLLKKVEKNSLNAEKQEKLIHNVGGEDFDVLTFTRKRRDDFVLAISSCGKDIKEQADVSIPFIYEAFQLKDLAVRAVDDGYIVKYHDIVKALFNTEEILEIVAYLYQINNVYGAGIDESVEEAKK